MLKYVLLPSLRFSPRSFQMKYLAQRAPKIRDILSRSPTAAPHLL